MNKINNHGKIKQSEHIFALKIKTESNGLGVLKTLIVLLLIISQAALLVLSYLYFLNIFRWYIIVSLILTAITCIYVLSSDFHGQAKATWILFLLICFSFGYIIYFMSDKHILFSSARKKYDKIFSKTNNIQKQIDLNQISNKEVKTNCQYLYNSGKFVSSNNSKIKYFPSGASLFDNILEEIDKAKDFIFLEFFIISDGVLLSRFLEILKEKAKTVLMLE